MIGSNYIHDDLARELRDALDENTNIRRLKLANNEVGGVFLDKMNITFKKREIPEPPFEITVVEGNQQATIKWKYKKIRYYGVNKFVIVAFPGGPDKHMVYFVSLQLYVYRRNDC